MMNKRLTVLGLIIAAIVWRINHLDTLEETQAQVSAAVEAKVLSERSLAFKHSLEQALSLEIQAETVTTALEKAGLELRVTAGTLKRAIEQHERNQIVEQTNEP